LILDPAELILDLVEGGPAPFDAPRGRLRGADWFDTPAIARHHRERVLADVSSLIAASFLNRARASLPPRAVDRRLNLCVLSAGRLADGEPSLGAAMAIAGGGCPRVFPVLEQDREGGTS
jgi:hypothetical protein